MALAAGMGLSAAESPAQEATAEAVVPAELDGTKWRLVEIDDRAPDSDLPAVTLSFGSARAEGSGGCNWYAGWLERGAAGRFVVSYLAVTRRDCGHPRIMDQEARYLAAFEGMETYRLNGDELELTASTNRNLVFRPD